MRHLCLVLTASASVLLASEQSRAQDISGSFNASITMGQERRVLGSTVWTPPSGSVAANITGPGILRFEPRLGGAPGPISVSTVNAPAFVLTGSGQIAINSNGAPFTTTITTTGANAYALHVTSGQHNELLNNVVITTSGTGADGIRIENPNNVIQAAGATLTTTGANASALALISGGGSTASFSNSALTSDGFPVIRVQGGSGKSINLTGTSVAAGFDGRWLLVSSATTNVTASRSTLSGAAVTSAGSSNLMLTNGTAWDMTGNSNVTNLTNDASLINFAAGGAFKTLTTVNYIGVGGTIGLNTFLGSDSSPSDLLVINGGAATGSSLLRITNAGGPGVMTTGNGILVVDATNGTTAPAAFALAGEARGGAETYYLFRGGLNGTEPESWFLRSAFTIPDNGNGGGGNGPGGGGNGNGGGGGNGDGGVVEGPNGETEFPTEPPPSVLPPGTYPIIGPELATYGAVQPIARQLGLSSLGTHSERTGDDVPCEPRDRAGPSAKPRHPEECQPTRRRAIWGRAFGQHVENQYQEYADPRATGVLAGFQTGIDLLHSDFIPGHMDDAGLYVAYAHGNIDVSGLVTDLAASSYVRQPTGKLELDAWSAGAYWSHIGPGGWYVDALVQGTRYGGAATTQFANLDITGTGFVASLEGGVPIALPLPGPGFVLEPQVQILWQQVSFDEVNDGLGPVALGTTSGAAGRLGLKGKWTIVTGSGQLWQPYVHANFWADWGDLATTTFSGVDKVPVDYRNRYMEVGGGLRVIVNAHLSLFGKADYQFAVTDFQRDGVKGSAGLRYSW